LFRDGAFLFGIDGKSRTVNDIIDIESLAYRGLDGTGRGSGILTAGEVGRTDMFERKGISDEITFGMKNFCLCILIVVVAVASGLAIGDQRKNRPATRPSPVAVKARPATKPSVLKLNHLRINRTKREVIVDAVVSLKKGALEFLLCKRGTKDYESLLVTDVSPSSLHAALLTLGLAPGKSAHWIDRAGKEAIFVPPEGAQLDITLRWKDSKSVIHQSPATDWMMDVKTGKKAKPTKWIFVGSAFLDDGRYWADVEGHLVSVANFASTVIDVPFRSTDKNALLEFAVNSDAVPAVGTPVEVIIKPVKGAEKAPVARITFSIDALGRIEMDGKRIAPEKIVPAVKEFLSRHAQACATVQIDPRAWVFDMQRLKRCLEQAGLHDITIRTTSLPAQVLPRTSREVDKTISWWNDQFSRAEELLVDPAEDAIATLKYIEKRRKDIEALSELWADYATRLRSALEKYRSRQAGQGSQGRSKSD